MTSRRKERPAEDPRLKLLLVDDGTLVTPPLMQALTAGGFRVELVADSEYALADTRGQRYDAVAINADFADVNPLWLCLALRVQGCPSVIMVIGEAASETDQLAAWRAGATDRVGHEMPREALVERLLAHVAGARIKVTGLVYPVSAEVPTTAGVFALSLVPTVVTLDDRPVSLTRIEERLFARLWSARGAAVPPDELLRPSHALAMLASAPPKAEQARPRHRAAWRQGLSASFIGAAQSPKKHHSDSSKTLRTLHSTATAGSASLCERIAHC